MFLLHGDDDFGGEAVLEEALVEVVWRGHDHGDEHEAEEGQRVEGLPHRLLLLGLVGRDDLREGGGERREEGGLDRHRHDLGGHFVWVVGCVWICVSVYLRMFSFYLEVGLFSVEERAMQKKKRDPTDRQHGLKDPF